MWSHVIEKSTDLKLSADVSSKKKKFGREFINVCEIQNRVQSVHISNCTVNKLAYHSEIAKQPYIVPSPSCQAVTYYC